MGECRTSCALPLRKQAGWMFLIQGLPGHFSMPVILLLDESAVIRQAQRRICAEHRQDHAPATKYPDSTEAVRLCSLPFNPELKVSNPAAGHVDVVKFLASLIHKPSSPASAAYLSFFPACSYRSRYLLSAP